MLIPAKVDKQAKKDYFITKEQVRDMFKTQKRNTKKYCDTAWSVTPAAAATSAGLVLNMPAIGTNIISSAAGNIRILGIDFTYDVQNVSTIPLGVRLMINQRIGRATPASGDILENVSSGPLSCISALSYQNQGKTVKTICDFTLDTDPDWRSVQLGKRHVKPSVRNVTYSSQNADWTSGVPYFNFFFHPNNTGGLTIVVYARIWFEDME